MKKVLLILAVALMLNACMVKPINNDPKTTENNVSCEGSYYLSALKNFKPGDKSVSSNSDNEDFDQFMKDVFSELIVSDYTEMHYTIKDYKAYGLEKPTVDLGEVSYKLDTELLDYYDGVLEDLHSFDYKTLSLRQQYDYDTLEYYCYETMGEICYYRYNFILGIATNVPEDVISVFTDFTFYDEESIDDYLTCLKDLGRYFDDVLKYTDDQAKAGYPLLDEWIDYTKNVCDGVQNKKDDNEFIVSFDKRMNALTFIDEAKKQEYMKQNKELVLSTVLPAYKKVGETVEKYRGKAKTEDYALYKLDKEYAEFAFMNATSCNSGIDEMFQVLTDTFALIQAEYLSVYYDEKAWQECLDIVYGNDDRFSFEGKDCLEYLRTHTDGYLPKLGDVDYSVEMLDPDTAPDTVIAYYWPNPIDDPNQNIIRVNPNNMGTGFDGYQTLAHEGFPGHLFQNVYYNKTNASPLRQYLGFIGYTEGWAVYASYLSFLMADLDYEYMESVLFYESNSYFIVDTLIDIMTNYYGYDSKQIYDYFVENSIFQVTESALGNLSKSLITMPIVYSRYGYGFCHIMEMREKVKAVKKEDFDLVDFNKSLLDNGSIPFVLLQSYVYDNYGVN